MLRLKISGRVTVMLPFSSYSFKRPQAKMWRTPLSPPLGSRGRLPPPTAHPPRSSGNPSPPQPDGFPPGRSSESEEEFRFQPRLLYPLKDHLCVQVVFKCLLVEKLKVERKQFPSRCLTTPSRTLPASGYRVLGAPTHILRPHTGGLTVLRQQLVRDP